MSPTATVEVGPPLSVNNEPVYFRTARKRCSRQTLSSVAMKKSMTRALIEVGFIVFLFYANLLMGEFERTGLGSRRGLEWALRDIFTTVNFGIAMFAALIGYALFEFLRNRF